MSRPTLLATTLHPPVRRGLMHRRRLVQALDGPARHQLTRSPEDIALSAETRAVIERAIRALPERQRTVLVLRDVGGWPANEVCTLVGVSTGNQRVLLHRARAAVRVTLTPYLDDFGRTDLVGV